MLNTGFNDRILLLIMVCSSIYNLIFTFSMNKSTSILKLHAMTFFTPAILCSATILYPSIIEVDKLIPLSEASLLVAQLFLVVFPYNNKNYRTAAMGIMVMAVLLAGYSLTADHFIYFSISEGSRHTINILLIIITIICIRIRHEGQKLLVPLSLLLTGIVIVNFSNQTQLDSLAAFLKILAYAAFTYYFYSATYSSYMNRINESEKIIRDMEHSLNKEVKKRVFEIERSNERLLEISKTDMLTKTFNKITIMNIIERLINNKKIDVFSILMFDIDNFKMINDSLGHVTGDLCLKTLANIASGNIREVDYLGRYGGDEFIIVLPTLGFNEARFVAERFKRKVNETSNPRFTVSIGISTYPDDGQSVNELISVADKGLYKSKSRGKNSISHVRFF